MHRHEKQIFQMAGVPWLLIIKLLLLTWTMRRPLTFGLPHSLNVIGDRHGSLSPLFSYLLMLKIVLKEGSFGSHRIESLNISFIVHGKQQTYGIGVCFRVPYLGLEPCWFFWVFAYFKGGQFGHIKIHACKEMRAFNCGPPSLGSLLYPLKVGHLSIWPIQNLSICFSLHYINLLENAPTTINKTRS